MHVLMQGVTSVILTQVSIVEQMQRLLTKVRS